MHHVTVTSIVLFCMCVTHIQACDVAYNESAEEAGCVACNPEQPAGCHLCMDCNHTHTALGVNAECTERSGQFVVSPPYGSTVPSNITISADSAIFPPESRFWVVLELLESDSHVYMMYNATRTNDDQVVFETQSVNDSPWEGSKWYLSILIGQKDQTIAGTLWQISSNFTFYGLPRVITAYPLKTIMAGGTCLTVEGFNFNVVKVPLIVITEVITNASGTFNSTYTQDCLIAHDTQIPGFTPRINQSEPAVPTSNASMPLNSEERTFYLSFKLNDQHIESFDGGMDMIPIEVYRNPSFQHFDPATKEYRPSDKHIDIKGHHLTMGVVLIEYIVHIGAGNATCNITYVSDNLIRCTPPKSLRNDTNKHAVKVHVGRNFKYTVGSLKFAVDDGASGATLPLVVGGSVGGVVLVLVILALVIAGYHKSRVQQRLLAPDKPLWDGFSVAKDVGDNTKTNVERAQHLRNTYVTEEGAVTRPGEHREASYENEVDGHPVTRDEIREYTSEW